MVNAPPISAAPRARPEPDLFRSKILASGERAFALLLLAMTVLAVSVPAALSPDFAQESHSATDGTGFAFNTAILPVEVTGDNPLLLVAWHAEYDHGFTDAWRVEFAGVPGTLLTDTNGYLGGDGSRLFRIYYWVNPTRGVNNVLVTDGDDSPNELAVSAVLFTNVAPNQPIGAVALDVSTNDRTGELESVPTVSGDLVVHVIAHRLETRGLLGLRETSRSIANDGHQNASVWISTRPGDADSTEVSSSDWLPAVLNGVALVLHAAGPGTPTIAPVPNQTTPVDVPVDKIPLELSDADTPAEYLSLSADSSDPELVRPEQIVFDGTPGAATMTLTPEPGVAGTAVITVTVSDGETTAGARFLLTVGESNAPPSLGPIPLQTISPLSEFALATTAADADAPTQTLIFGLVSAPAGATIDRSSGLLDWSPSAEQAGSTNILILRVSDSGLPSLSSTQSVVIVVAPSTAALQLEQVDAGTFRLHLRGLPATDYEIQFSEGDDPLQWRSLTRLTADDTGVAEIVDTPPNGTAARFYRAAKSGP